ncbi:hypothetical protein H6S82_00030 [Planktothrix sp. FACHB-1355]|uniref:Uncharacterized protein n=1 Tax=Aerosakkonema funiforme FACHB-1375 TaxID=2949571 RepID=A0A926VDR1_9CYAN|nr:MULTISPECIES: hypothetical protein [Oscillatoriales]MBD2181840.1 hypothetical protein [Aerosakkonema funiforme FACHB-1375]MBD3557260.1 hypothetical protein [Planktothrix sp. FACHB-1355]
MNIISMHRLAKFIPLLRRGVWRSLNIELNAYQLPDENFVFTFRQIANPVGLPSQSVLQFLEKTETADSVFEAYLPNYLLASVCTLRTAAQYWQYLVTQTEPTKKAKNQPRQLWSAAEYYLNSQANGCDYLALSDPSSEPGYVKVINIFHVKLLDYTDSSLQVLAGKHTEGETLYLIEVASFLELIGFESDWLARPASPVRRTLYAYGLTREPLACYLENGAEVLTFTLSDCLAICEYLILKKGNSRAADFLIALGRIPLEARCQVIRTPKRSHLSIRQV